MHVPFNMLKKWSILHTCKNKQDLHPDKSFRDFSTVAFTATKYVSMHVFRFYLLNGHILTLLFTSAVPVEHETLKSGWDDGRQTDGRWKDRREG